MGTMLDHKAVPWIFYTASLLVYHVGAALYSVNELQPSSRFELVGRLTFIVAVWYWFLLYSRVRRIAWPLDMGLFLTAAYFIIIPYHALRAEGRRGWVTVSALVAIFVATNLVGLALYYALWSRGGGAG